MTKLNPFFCAAAGLFALYISAYSLGEQAEKSSDPLTVERVSIEPDARPGTDSLRWSPDGARVAWMNLVVPPAKARDTTLQQEIWSFDTKEGRGTSATLLVPTAKVTTALRGSAPPSHPGIKEDDENGPDPYFLRDFAWSNDHASLLLVASRSLAWLDIAGGTFKTLITGKEPIEDVSLSPDGKTVSFIRGGGLCLLDVASGTVRVLAASPKADILEGGLDWPYRNELHLKRGYWWSPDSERIAYFETDDRLVAKYPLRSSDGEEREIVYPKPGGELPEVHVFVARVAAGKAVEVDLGATKGMYVPRVAWLPDGHQLAVERLDRRQQALELLLADAVTGKTQSVFTEKDRYWINLNDDLHFFKDGSRFLWSSQREGFRRVYLYDLQGKELGQLTKGDWEVSKIDFVDESKGLVYLTGTEKSPLERHLYQLKLSDLKLTRLTQQAGTHLASFAPDGDHFVDQYSNQTEPPRFSLVTTAAPVAAEPATTAKDTGKASDLEAAAGGPSGDGTFGPLEKVDFLTVKMHMGVETHALLLRPPDFDATRKYPVIMYMAGGPGEQLVRDAWGGSMGLWMRLMARKGYILFALDNQGTDGLGHYFEEPIHLRLGAQEMTDQRDALAYLKTLPFVDPARMGVVGWGYGGFLVVHSMLDRPTPFKAGFAGAPVTDWHFYDAIFGERYLDDPVVHADGWAASTALDNAHFLRGALMLAQGTEDEFVHMENILTLQDRLLNSGKTAETLLFPDRGHEIEDRPSRLVLYNQMTEFFVKNL